MIVHQVFAMIKDEVVQNIMVCDNYEVANQLSRVEYGETAIAVECTQYACAPGDKYINSTFCRSDGVTIIPRQNTAEEDAAIANARTVTIENHQTEVEIDVDFRLSMLEM